MKHQNEKNSRHSVFDRSSLSVAIAMATMLPALGVQAQGSLVLEEVVVTASKKQEVLSDVASTVNVVTGESLKKFNVFQFEDVQKLSPGLTLRNFSARSSGISLRGAPYLPDSSAQPTVVTYWNGIPVLPNVAFNQLFDLERMEVLRGAQGTLQGETSPSGAIQIHTRKANTAAMDGYVRQSFDDNDGSVTEFAMGMPLVEDKAALRIATVHSQNAVWGEESINSGEEASSRTKAARVNLYLTPTDALDASFNYEYLERDADGLTAVEGVSRLGNGMPRVNTYDRVSLEESRTSVINRNELASLEVNYEAAGNVFTLVSGYQDILSYSDLDIDAGNILSGFALPQETATTYEIWTHEFRIANSDPDFWGYLFGAYYYNLRSGTVNDNITPSLFSHLPGLLPPTLGIPGLPGSEAWGVIDSTTFVPVSQETIALFMNHTFYVTDRLTVDAGLRWQTTKQSLELTTVANGDVTFDPRFPPLIREGDVLAVMPNGLGESDANTVTGSFKVSYDLTPETMIYTSYGRGYRPAGSVVEPTLGIDLNLVRYDEETSDSLEFGFKSVLDDGRYQINGAVYYQKFDGFINRSEGTLLDLPPQGGGASDGLLDTSLSGGINYNTDAIIRGVELEGTALLTADWLLFASLSYNDSKFDGAKVPCGNFGDAADPGSQIRTCESDGRLGPSPNWSASVTSEYTFREVAFGADAYVRALYRFTGSLHDDFAAVNTQLYDEYRIGGHGVWDLYMGLRAPDDSWEVSLWAKNVFDKQARTALGSELVLSGNNFLTGGLPETLASGYSPVSIIPERTIGITATWHFGMQ